MKRTSCLFLLLALLLGSCSNIRPTPGTASPTLHPSATPVTPTPTLPPSETPEPTHRPIPTPTLLGAPAAKSFEYRIVAYFPSWGVYARKFSAVQAQVGMVSHINYAFGKVNTTDLTCVYADLTADDNNFADLRRIKAIYPHLKVLLSLGGWTLSDGFSDAALTEASRQKFVKSCIDLYMGYYPEVFDGFDIDWEYPVGGGLDTMTYRPEDKHNLTLLAQEFRKQLDELGKQNGKQYLVTAAVPAGPSNYQNFELKELAQILDWMNIMAFDFHGAWDKTTNFNAPLYKAKGDPSETSNVDAAVKAYLAAGVPAKKLNIGIPFYGRGWSKVPADNHGLYQSTGGQPLGTYMYGVYDYWDIASRYVYQQGYVRYWDDEAKAPWLYNATEQTFITYDDPQSVGIKADYIRENELGGAMVWDLSNDDGTLLGTLFYRLFTRPNLMRP